MPAPELQSDTIAITGLAANLDRAKAGLLERVKELQAEQEDRVSKDGAVCLGLETVFRAYFLHQGRRQGQVVFLGSLVVPLQKSSRWSLVSLTTQIKRSVLLS